MRVVAEAGLRGLTHRAVDREAGFPEGTCSVSFRTRAALLTALTDHIGGLLAADVRRMGEGLPVDPNDPLTSLPTAVALLTDWVSGADGGACVLAVLELWLESVRTPELAGAVGEWRSELVTIVEDIMERSAIGEARLRAETTVAALQGILLSALRLPAFDRGSYIEETLYRVFVGTSNP